MFFLLLLLFFPLLLLLLGWLSVEVCPFWILCLWLNLLCRLFRAYGGKLQACKAFLMCPNVQSAFWLVETILVICADVLKTLFVVVMKWLLSQCRYWYVCRFSVDSGAEGGCWDLEETKVSKNGTASSLFGSSIGNCMFGSCELMFCSSC